MVTFTDIQVFVSSHQGLPHWPTLPSHSGGPSPSLLPLLQPADTQEIRATGTSSGQVTLGPNNHFLSLPGVLG